jgi:hypothetical protein
LVTNRIAEGIGVVKRVGEVGGRGLEEIEETELTGLVPDKDRSFRS